MCGCGLVGWICGIKGYREAEELLNSSIQQEAPKNLMILLAYALIVLISFFPTTNPYWQ
jgi:hypothetical protein